MSLILVVEPENRYIERISDALGADGWKVQAVPGHDEALAAVASQSPDLILVSAQAPGAERVVSAFSRRAGGPGVLVLLAEGEEANGRFGAEDRLGKPFTAQELRLAVKRAAAVRREAAAPAAVDGPKLTSRQIFGDLLAEVEDEVSGAHKTIEPPAALPAGPAPPRRRAARRDARRRRRDAAPARRDHLGRVQAGGVRAAQTRRQAGRGRRRPDQQDPDRAAPREGAEQEQGGGDGAGRRAAHGTVRRAVHGAIGKTAGEAGSRAREAGARRGCAACRAARKTGRGAGARRRGRADRRAARRSDRGARRAGARGSPPPLRPLPPPSRRFPSPPPPRRRRLRRRPPPR